MSLRQSSRVTITLATLLTLSLASINAIAAPKVIYKDIQSKYPAFAATKMPQSIQGVIKSLETKEPDLYQIVVYKMKDHYILYQMSGKKWLTTKTRIDLDRNDNVKQITEPYFENTNDKDELKNYDDKKGIPVCPDESVQFVAISAYPGVAGVDRAIAVVSDAAKRKYKTVTILGDKADGKTYRNWMACSGLKGFYSISHGSPEGIYVANGEIVDSDFFSKIEVKNNFKNTTVILNACQVFNYPFGTQIMYGNAETISDYADNPGPNAYEFMGGHTNLMMVYSELSSACFMAQAIMGAKMDYHLLKLCANGQEVDFFYKNFGLSNPGRYFDSNLLIGS